MRESAKFFIIITLGLLGLAVAYFIYGLSPVASGDSMVFVEVKKGDGFRDIAKFLEAKGLIRSATAFKLYSMISGSAHRLKPGNYSLSPSWNAAAIVNTLVEGPAEDISITIVEGETVLDINKKLHNAGVLGDGISISKKMEGYLFPDTYRFFPNSSLDEVIKKFEHNFKVKTAELFQNKNEDFKKKIITIASLIEKEVPFHDDRFLVSGILWNRLKVDMPLQVDASVCYAKHRTSAGCYPLKRSDFQIDSLYNTYKYYGLPPGPIGNPGLSAIEAAMNPKNSDFWYYLSDPETKKTIFAKDLEEHNENRAKYLGL